MYHSVEPLTHKIQIFGVETDCHFQEPKPVIKTSIKFSFACQETDISHFIWVSVGFSHQLYTNKFSRIQKLARFLQDSCKFLNPS